MDEYWKHVKLTKPNTKENISSSRIGKIIYSDRNQESVCLWEVGTDWKGTIRDFLDDGNNLDLV